MTGSIPPPGPLAYDGQVAVPYISRPFSPLATNTNFPLSTIWINTLTGAAFILVNKAFVAGAPNAIWEAMGATGEIDTITTPDATVVVPTLKNINFLNGTGMNITGAGSNITFNTTIPISSYPITPYVVGLIGQAGYQTIQSAINAAQLAGGGLVFIQGGTYTENLTLFDNIQLFGDSESATIIIGVHTPPASGKINIWRMTLQSATHIFSSAAAGSTQIIIEDITFNVTNGYAFNLLNWTGNIQIFDSGDISTNNGGINNTGGASIAINCASIGAGSVNTMIISGPFEIQTTFVGCPVQFVSTASFSINDTVFIYNVLLSNSSTGSFVFSNCFNSFGGPSITMSSTAAVSIISTIIDTISNPSISGAGAGILTLGDITFTGNSNISGALTLLWLDTNLGSTTVTDLTDTSLTAYSVICGGNTSLLPVQSVASVGAAGQVLTSSGAAALPVWSAPAGGFTWVLNNAGVPAIVNTGYLANSAGAPIACLLPAVSAVGDVIGFAALPAPYLGWVIQQGAGQYIQVGNITTTVGVGGILGSTQDGDAATLVCIEANLGWIVINSVGNLRFS